MPKPKANAFMVFTNEWRRGKNLSINEAVAQAGEIWKNMNAQERKPYSEKAKNVSLQPKHVEKMSCTGVPLSVLENQRREKEEKERSMRRNTESMVRNSLDNDELAKQKYIFIMVNYFTRKINCGDFIPAELALAEYSLGDGITRVYHTLINPGDNMYGLQFEAQQHADMSHKLPLPPNALGDRNMGRIYREIVAFLGINDRSSAGAVPPMFTLCDQMPIVESVLKVLSDYHDRPINFNIYSIQYLFFNLKDAVCRMADLEPPASYFITDVYFNGDYFEYKSGIACEYHEEMDNTKYCCKSYVIRWGYMFSDYMCKDIAIQPVPGRHLPADTSRMLFVDENASEVASTADTESMRGGVHYANQFESESVASMNRHFVKPRQPLTVASGATAWNTRRVNEMSFHHTVADEDDEDMESLSSLADWNDSRPKNPARKLKPANTSFDIDFNQTNERYMEDFPPPSASRKKRDISFEAPSQKSTGAWGGARNN